MKYIRTIIGIALGVTLAAVLNNCSATGVEVWERDILTRPGMQLDNRAHDDAIDDHIYFSKEAASGGRGFGGGGCGCN